MSEQIQAIRGWIRNAVEGEEKKVIKQLHNKHFMTDYERGRMHGAISAYHHVLVETSPTSAWKIPYNAFNVWVTDICEHTALTAREAIEIYNFCDSNDLLNMHNVISIIIERWWQGHNQYDIINILKHEAIRQGKGRRAKKWRRKEKDE